MIGTTHIRIPRELKGRLDSITQNSESTGAVITRLVDFYENNGGVNIDVNDTVNAPQQNVTDDVNIRLTELSSNVNAELTELTTRLDNFVTSNNYSKDETGHALEMIYEMQERLTSLEALSGKVDSLAQSVADLSAEVNTLVGNKEMPSVADITVLSPEEKNNLMVVTADMDIPISPVESSTTYEEDRITLTDEIRQALISHVNKLQDGGMSYKAIADHLGVGKGRISELKSGKLKTLTRSQYGTLMSL